jgi:hypothetical protein
MKRTMGFEGDNRVEDTRSRPGIMDSGPFLGLEQNGVVEYHVHRDMLPKALGFLRGAPGFAE